MIDFEVKKIINTKCSCRHGKSQEKTVAEKQFEITQSTWASFKLMVLKWMETPEKYKKSSFVQTKIVTESFSYNNTNYFTMIFLSCAKKKPN